ncbi:MAG: hypothetical protein HC836_24305 [Richelia sp. RM2_1_2]|nr:hypothetical protein [Richelia sp. RM2_1_2]
MKLDQKLINKCIYFYKEKNYSRTEISNLIREATGLGETQGKLYAKEIWDEHIGGDYVPIYLREGNEINQTIDLTQENKTLVENIDKNHIEISYNGKNIKTIDELLKACNIDLTVWEVERQMINKWDVARKDQKKNVNYDNGVISGYSEDTGDFNIQELFQVKVWLVRRSPISLKEILSVFIDESKKYSPKLFNKPEIFKKTHQEENLYIIAPVDHHLAKLAWNKETGFKENWDIGLAVESFNNLIESAIQRVQLNEVSKVLFLIGNDYFNADNLSNTTTAGTPQAQDSRWPKMFETGCKLMVDSIDKISSLWPVDVLTVPGNHDRHTSYLLGEYLKAWYRNSESIFIINDPLPRHYYKWGKNLLGFAHGEKGKKENFPLDMATDPNSKKHWSQCDYFTFFLGHFHHQDVKEIRGVKVEVLPSLCPADLWHTENHFCGNQRTSKTFLYNKENGLLTSHYFNQ